MRTFFRRLRDGNKLDSDLVVQPKAKGSKQRGLKLGSLRFNRSHTAVKGASNAGPSATRKAEVYEELILDENESRITEHPIALAERLDHQPPIHDVEHQPSETVLQSAHLPPVSPHEPHTASSPSNIVAGTSSLAQDRESSSEENESSIITGHPTASTERLSRQDDPTISQLEHTNLSIGPILPSVASSPANITSGSEQPSTIDASVCVSHQGVTYNVSGSAVVHFVYGSQIDQRRDKHPLDEIIRTLVRSHNAEFDMVMNATRGPCTPQTRTTILQKLGDWCNTIGVMLYWMNGMAGTGKTTIAYSLCQMLESANLLGASFFCSRSLPDCRKVSLIIPTIAFQLAQRYPSFAEALAEALHKDTDILHRNLDIQLCRLIIEPWSAKKGQLPSHIIIVLDALDECDEAHSNFLRVIFNHATKLPFKVMITSRPEPSIRDIMTNKTTISGTLATFILHEVEKDLVQEDIAKYLSSELSPHASLDDIHFLADLAGSLFIFAATLARFLTARNVNIARRIKLIRESLPTTKLKMLALLDELYKGVLRAAFNNDLVEEEVQEMKETLFTVVYAREPLTRKAIASLWNITPKDVEDRLDGLRSVIFFPPSPHQPLTTFHASFQDFILDPSRSGEFHYQPLSPHLMLFQCCLSLMRRELRHNICRLDGRPPNDMVDPDLIHKHISPSLQYANIYWLEHWMLSDRSECQAALGSIQNFLTTDVLCWFECLSHIGRLSVSIESLEMLRDTLNRNTKLTNIVHDSLWFIQQVYDLVEYSAMQIYHDALIWIPSNSPLRTHYASLCKQTPQLLCGLPMIWSGPDQAINIHSDLIDSIAISQDGRSIISGSRDNTVRIWNVRSHIEECVLSGHTEHFTLVAIYADGSHAISGSYNGNVHVWNLTTHEAILTLQSEGPVTAAALSPGDKWIASGHIDGSVRIWSATDGRLIHSLEHGDHIRSVQFTHDGTRLVSGSDDKTARMWNVITGAMECIFHGHKGWVLSVACSPSGDKIATGSTDHTARLWDMSGNELHVLRAHSHNVECVAFMPDGKQVVTADEMLRIWDVVSGDLVRIFSGLAYGILSVAVFPDGLKIASSSGSTISIWHLRGEAIGGGEQNDEASLPNVKAESMVFSENGQRVLLLPSLRILDTATLEEKAVLGSDGVRYSHGTWSISGSRVAASFDGKIELWELSAGDAVANRFTLQNHTKHHSHIYTRITHLRPFLSNEITCVSISRNEHQLVSASADGAAQVWDIATRKQIHILDHLFAVYGAIYSAIYSHDDTQIISTASETVHVGSAPVWNAYVWSAQSGELLHKFQANAIFAAFSLHDHYIITYNGNTISVYNAKTCQLEHTHEGYTYWTTMNDDSSYALSNNGWICHFPRLGDQPRRLRWIPSQYRPTVNTNNSPLFTPTPSGVQVCLPTRDRIVTFVIPHDT